MKSTKILFTGLIALSLSACGATTGSLSNSAAKQAIVHAATSNPLPVTAPAYAPAMDVNSTLDCAALKVEIEKTDGVIAASTQALAKSGATNLAGKLAATGASQAALHSGAAGALAKVPFGGLFAKSARDAVANSGRKAAEKAQADLQAANLRKASLSGLYSGKNCTS